MLIVPGRLGSVGGTADLIPALWEGVYGAPGTTSRALICTGTVANSNWICRKDDGGIGNVAMELGTGVLGTGGVGLPSDAVRAMRTYSMTEAFLLNSLVAASSGTVTTGNLDSGTTSHPHGITGNILRPIPFRQIASGGNYIEFNTWVGADGRFTVAYSARGGMTTPGATSNTITDGVSGQVIATNFTGYNSTPIGLKFAEFTHPTKRNMFFNCRFTKVGGTGFLEVSGVNAVVHSRPDFPEQTGAAWNFDTFVHDGSRFYIDEIGSNDIAMHFEGTTGTVGSAHGGDENITLSATLDGAPFTIGTRGVGYSLIVNQQTRVFVPGTPGPEAIVTMRRAFDIDGRIKVDVTINTNTALRPFYTGMSCTHPNFIELVEPRAIANVSGKTGDGDDTDQYLLGTALQTVQRSPTTGQVVTLFSSAPRDIPDFEQTILSWQQTIPNPPDYAKIRFWSSKSPLNPKPAGTYKYHQAHSFKRAA